MKIEEVAMNWNNFYATLPISIFTPPCREPTTAVSATFGNRPALSSSGGDVGAHQCPRFHLKLFAAQKGEMSWCKTRIRNVQVLEHFGTKRCISSYSFPSLVQSPILQLLISTIEHHFWIHLQWMPRRVGVLEVGWLLIFCRSYLQLESRAGWPLFLRRGGGRCIMNDPAASFNFPLFSFLQQLLVIYLVHNLNILCLQRTAETADKILYIKKVLGGKRVTSVQGKWLDSTLSLTELSKNNIIQIEAFCSGDMND